MPNTKRFPTFAYVLVLGLIGLIALAPLLSVLLASWIANAAGCALDEGSSHPCMIGGKDRGELLYTMFVMGWFMFLTLPAGAMAFTAWTITFVLHRASWRRRQSASSA